MAQMIDTDAFRNYLEMMQEANKNEHKEYVYYLGYAIEHLNDFTEVEGIEIVRCKDCIHFDPNKALRPGGIWCEYWGTDPDPEDWCCKGERKDND